MSQAIAIEKQEKIGSGVPRSENHLVGVDLIVPDMHCAGCMRKIETGLGAVDGIAKARCNLSTRRVHVDCDGARLSAIDVVNEMERIGFSAVPFDPKLLATSDEEQSKSLLRAVGVSGFAAANIMLLSVSVWSGLASDMEPETRNLFHWVSALIAMPTVAYAGRPFFRSAWAALKSKNLNMDVPISLAVLLATITSLFETVRGADQVYFDAAVTLLFFLLIGRFLDLRMRARACSAAQNLLSLRAQAATIVTPDGARQIVPVDTLQPGQVVAIAPGARIPTDGRIKDGKTDVDVSLITGESLPQSVALGAHVFAGTLNLSAPITVEVTKRDEDSLLAEIVRLMEAAEQGRAGYVRLADRIAKIYAPGVHILALVTFLGWLLLGASAHSAMMTAIAVLIVTCPCALGLAVPVVQVVASGRLLRHGVLVKSADALERLADIDSVVFDKTGTITTGTLELLNADQIATGDLALAASLARESRHPLAMAVARKATGEHVALGDVVEEPGMGLKGRLGDEDIYLGNWRWVGLNHPSDNATSGPELWLRCGEAEPKRFDFQDSLKEDASAVVTALKGTGLPVHLLSGDRSPVVINVAKQTGIDQWSAECTPSDKISNLELDAGQGHKTLMVGDGLNDAPALRAAYVSMSPASAADISQTAADFVFQGEKLAPILDAIFVARTARRLILQNFSMAFLYNAVAIPLAMAGLITPLFAAIAMSSSSILVTANAMRLNLGGKPKRSTAP